MNKTPKRVPRATSFQRLRESVDFMAARIEGARMQHKRWAKSHVMRDLGTTEDFADALEGVYQLIDRWERNTNTRYEAEYHKLFRARVKPVVHCHDLIKLGQGGRQPPKRNQPDSKAHYYRDRIEWTTAALEREFDDRRRLRLMRSRYYAQVELNRILGKPLPPEPDWLRDYEVEGGGDGKTVMSTSKEKNQ